MIISRKEYARALDEAWREGRDKGYAEGVKQGRAEQMEDFLHRQRQQEEAQRQERTEMSVVALCRILSNQGINCTAVPLFRDAEGGREGFGTEI